jgi:hypothetical protein
MMIKTYYFLQWVILLGGLLFLACACSTDSAIQKVLGSSAETPVFLGLKAVSSREIHLEFSLPVNLSSLRFDPPLDIESVTEGSLIQVRLVADMKGGAPFVADLLVEDDAGNTLAVLIPFRGRNDRVPGFIITELRTEYANPRVEFVELRTLSPGNMGAVRLFIASLGMGEPVFEFPPVEVEAGEYLLIHLRTLDQNSLDETGEDRDLSPGSEAVSGARDFWVPGAVKRLRKTDAVLVMDQDDRVLDAVLLTEKPDEPWAREGLDLAADILNTQGAWVPQEGSAKRPGPPDGVSSKGATATRTICRDEAGEDSNTVADWYIAATSQATPGKPNSTKRYAPYGATTGGRKCEELGVK